MIEHLGRHEIIEVLGRGAMGVVYRARDPEIDRVVAIKTIELRELDKNKRDEYEARFRSEAQAAGQLNHPNVVTIHDVGRSGDVAYIAMELVQGRNLGRLIADNQQLPVDEVLDIAIQVALGLDYAGRHGIVHRDIKPSNILLQDDGRVKIVDFGIAKMATSPPDEAGMPGSPSYMSPEQVMGRPVDSRSDIFSLGIVLHQLLAGTHPFAGENVHSVMYQIVNEAAQRPSVLRAEVPDMLDPIVARCLAKDPEARYQHAGELADDLRACRAKLSQAQAGLEWLRNFSKGGNRNIHQLLYVSRSSSDVAMAELLDILTRAQYKNMRLDVSGLLVFRDGRFMQLLEGAEQTVKDLFATIRHDPRHTNVEVLWENDRAARCMPSWVMGFSASEQGSTDISARNFYIPPDVTVQICESMEGEAGARFLQFLRGWQALFS
jgi:serine/threonine protein kinase